VQAPYLGQGRAGSEILHGINQWISSWWKMKMSDMGLAGRLPRLERDTLLQSYGWARYQAVEWMNNQKLI